VIRNILNGGYSGKVYPVNPKAAEILDLKCYSSVKEIPDIPDVAILTIPASIVADAITELGEKEIKVAVIITSGFAEIGNIELQQKLVDTARKAGVRIVGPNIFGYYYTPIDLCATFCTPYTKKGGIAFTCQSGGVGMATIGFTRSRAIGVSAIVGLGNKVDVDEADLLEFFAQDNNTKVIAMHIEDLKDARRFVEVAKRVTKVKPIILFKVGRTESGAKAAASHTGAVAGTDAIYGAAFKQCGVIRAPTLENFLDWARAHAVLPLPRGENVLIHTSAGGLGVILADACTDYGLKLMEVPEDLQKEFQKYVPPFGSLKNPIDITGSNTPENNLETMRIAIMDPRVHAIIFGYWHTIITPPMAFAKCLSQAVEEAREKEISKPMVASLSGDIEVEEAARYLEERGIPSYPYAPDRAVSALASLYEYARNAGILEGRKEG